MTTCEYHLPAVYQESRELTTGGVSKHHYGSVVAFIKLIFEMGIVSNFWASQERGYPLGDIESEELGSVSLFNLFLRKKPQNGQLTHYQNLIKFCYCSVTQLCATL